MGSPDEASEQSLVQRARAGDDEALGALLGRYESILLRRIATLLPPGVRRRVSPSDVLQEVRLTAADKRGDFEWRHDGSFRAWLFAIADRKARRTIQRHRDVAGRSVRREVTRAQRLDTQQYAGHMPSPSEAAVGAELGELARRAMEALSPDYREVLRLCREQELTTREAAELMGRSREATKKLYGRALLRFTAIFIELRGESNA